MQRFCSKCGGSVEPNAKFCGKCGSALDASATVAAGESQVVQSAQNTAQVQVAPVVQAVKPVQAAKPRLSRKQRHIVAICVAVGVLVIALVVLAGVGVNLSKKYYFDTEGSDAPSGEVAQDGGSGSSTTRKKKNGTVIIYDNTYSGVSIGGAADAYKLIESDSVSQKDQCPREILQVENEIITKLGITAVNLCEMDVDFARELAKVFQKIYNEYPGARGYITNFTLVNTPASESYIAAFMPTFGFATADTKSTYPWVMKTQVLLNAAYFLNQERLDASVQGASKSGHFPKNSTIYSPVAHELGHFLSFLAMMKNYDMESVLLVDSGNMEVFYQLCEDFVKGDYSLNMIQEAYQRYLNDTGDNIGLDDWRGTISDYALAKDNSGDYIYDETIAESFHDVYLNGDNAATASKYITNVLKERLGQ